MKTRRLTEEITEEEIEFQKEMCLPKYKYRPKGTSAIYDCVDNLGQLEDIEEELGINLITLFKALNQFYAKDLDCYCPRPTILFKSFEDEWFIKWINNSYKLKDYGKTWALTKE